MGAAPVFRFMILRVPRSFAPFAKGWSRKGGDFDLFTPPSPEITPFHPVGGC